MIDDLFLTLEQQYAHLSSLSIVMKNEQLLLSHHKVPTSAFQEVTEQKRFLLAALSHGEKSRNEFENQLNIAAPYTDSESLQTIWQSIITLTTELKDLNYRNQQMMQFHQQMNDERMAFLKQHNNQAVYGADGQSQPRSMLGKKITI